MPAGMILRRAARKQARARSRFLAPFWLARTTFQLLPDPDFLFWSGIGLVSNAHARRGALLHWDASLAWTEDRTSYVRRFQLFAATPAFRIRGRAAYGSHLR